jgi:hypothetical protein
MDPGETQALRDIEAYGCHVIHVMADGDLPPFSYSVGIERTSQAPELFVIGLKQELAHFIVNSYNRRVRGGEVFENLGVYNDFIEGFGCQMRVMDQCFYKNYLGWCRWMYGGNNFKVLQLVYPTTEGIWPWEPRASEWFRTRQPLLDQPAPIDQGGLH